LAGVVHKRITLETFGAFEEGIVEGFTKRINLVAYAI
jgi:hypothetical protein